MFKLVQGNIKPNFLDIENNIYIVRKDVKDISYVDEEKRKVAMFEWQEAQMTAEEYSQYKLVEKNAGDIEYIAMMTGVDLED